MGPSVLLVAFDNGRVLVDGRALEPLPGLLVVFGDASDQPRLKGLQLGNAGTGRQDETLLHLPLRAEGLQGLVMEAVQEIPHRADPGRA